MKNSLSKVAVKKALHVLNKIADNRFKFNFYIAPCCEKINIEMYFCNNLVSVCASDIDDLNNDPELFAFDSLVWLVKYAELRHDVTYFEKIGINFELYLNKLNGKNYFSFRKNESAKWVKISQYLAKCIIESNDIEINGLCDNVVSYREYDCYYTVNIKV